MNEKKITLEVTVEEALFIQIATSFLGQGKAMIKDMANTPDSSLSCIILSSLLQKIDVDKLQGKLTMAIQSSATTCN